jgi:hypothetical protein
VGLEGPPHYLTISFKFGVRVFERAKLFYEHEHLHPGAEPIGVAGALGAARPLARHELGIFSVRAYELCRRRTHVEVAL